MIVTRFFRKNNFFRLIAGNQPAIISNSGSSSSLLKKLDIYKKSPHKIRKTYGSILLDHNIDNRMIMEQMGHIDITCTENHYHRNRRNLDAKSQILSSIPELQAK